jgi:hypothetical protein
MQRNVPCSIRTLACHLLRCESILYSTRSERFRQAEVQPDEAPVFVSWTSTDIISPSLTANGEGAQNDQNCRPATGWQAVLSFANRLWSGVFMRRSFPHVLSKNSPTSKAQSDTYLRRELVSQCGRTSLRPDDSQCDLLNPLQRFLSYVNPLQHPLIPVRQLWTERYAEAPDASRANYSALLRVLRYSSGASAFEGFERLSTESSQAHLLFHHVGTSRCTHQQEYVWCCRPSPTS